MSSACYRIHIFSPPINILIQVFIILEFLLTVFAPSLKPVHTKFLFVRNIVVQNVIITLATFRAYRLVCMSKINCLAHIITFVSGIVNTVAAKIEGAKPVSGTGKV